MTSSKDLRKRVLAAIAQGMSPTTASRTFQVSRATLYRWLDNPEPKPLPKKRQLYARQRRLLKQEGWLMVYCDETGFQPNAPCLHGWSDRDRSPVWHRLGLGNRRE